MKRSTLLAAACWLALSGGSGCGGSINEYLLVARKGDDEQVRAAVEAIGTELHRRQAAGFELNAGELAAMAFLREVALSHRDPISRMVGLSSLALLESPDNISVYRACLDDDHYGVRWEAAKALVLHPASEAAEELAARVFEEPKPEVRIDLIKALAAVGDEVALGVLLEVLLDASGRFDYDKLKAYRGVVSISGREYAFENQEAWQQYYESRFGAEGRTPGDGLPERDAELDSTGAPSSRGDGDGVEGSEP